MFGLPIETFFLVFAFPVLWIIYTLEFLRMSRNWDDEFAGDEDS